MIHLLRSAGFESGASVTPVADLLRSLGPGLLEQAHAVASMLEFVDVGPNLGLPGLIVHCRLSTARAPSMELSHNSHCGGHCSRQFDKNAADFLNIIIIANEVFVAQQIAKSQLARFHFRLGAGVKGPIFRAQLFGGITGHPESFLVLHLPLEVAGRICEILLAPVMSNWDAVPHPISPSDRVRCATLWGPQARSPCKLLQRFPALNSSPGAAVSNLAIIRTLD